MSERCGAKTKSGTPCQQPAGWGTEHVGEGRCKLHGGNAGRPPTHGRYSVRAKEALQDKVEAFRQDPQIGTLWDELALQRAILQNYLDEMGAHLKGGNAAMLQGVSETVMDMTEAISRTLDRINKIMSRTALTQAEIQYLQARFADILTKYVPQDQRHSALRELRRAVERD